VKGVGYAAVEAIKHAREDGPFVDLFDFCERIDSHAVNRKAIEALIKCGALGSTGSTRKGLLAVLEQAQAAGQKAQQDASTGQASFFDLGFGDDGNGAAGGAAFGKPTHVSIPTDEFDQNELLALEKESIGLFLSTHPLKPVRTAMSLQTECELGETAKVRDGERVVLGGMLSQVKRLRTKKGDPMVFATLEDLTGAVELVIFADVLEESGDAVEQDAIVLVKGRLEHKDSGSNSVLVGSVERFEPSAEEIAAAEVEAAKLARQVPADALKLRLNVHHLTAPQLDELRELLQRFPGESDVVVELVNGGPPRRLRLGESFRVQRSAGLHAELATLLRDAVVSQPAA